MLARTRRTTSWGGTSELTVDSKPMNLNIQPGDNISDDLGCNYTQWQFSLARVFQQGVISKDKEESQHIGEFFLNMCLMGCVAWNDEAIMFIAKLMHLPNAQTTIEWLKKAIQNTEECPNG
jgi:hypothetical protein